MDKLIPVVNKLQDVFGAIGHQGIDLPQIVVVGSQSSGKSSVLENIVGRDFLPRGAGICTRRPLVLQLYSIPIAETASEGEEWAEFLHIPGKKFYSFEEVRNEIHRETDRITGKNKGISNKSINLKIFSPYVLNLTLVDLPGITKVPTGDQPEDIEEQIREMCYQFISNPNAIILAVTAANQDLVNSDGLKMARAVDPDGDRTIGVLTKVDIMDAGTDCVDILSNRVVPLRRGYVAVMNRSQKDIQDNVPIRTGTSKELAFFQSHPRYQNLLHRCGTPNLAVLLNQILLIHIRDCLPEIKSKISKMMVSVQSSLDSLGECPDSQDRSAMGATLLTLISGFVANFGSSIDGRAAAKFVGNVPAATGYLSLENLSISGGANGSSAMELHGGARIAYIFNELFGKSLRAFDPFDGLDDEGIRTAIANANGTRQSLFVPEISFDLLVRRQIARLEDPSLQCVDMIFEEMHRIASRSETPEIARFPELRDRLYEIINAMLRNCVKPAKAMISNLIQVELAFINTSHPDFIGGKQALAYITRKMSQPPPPQPAPMDGAAEPNASAQGNNASSAASSVASLASTGPTSHQQPPPPPIGTPVPSSSSSSGAVSSVAVSQQTGTVPSSSSNPNQGGFFSLFRQQDQQNPQNLHQQQQQPQHQQQQQPSQQAVASQSTPVATKSSHPHHSMRHAEQLVTQGHPSHQSLQVVDSDGVIKLPQAPERMKIAGTSSDWGRRETEIIKVLISSYFDIVRKTFMDLVPKAIMHFLVNGFKENLQNELVKHLYRDALMSTLLAETDEIALRRKACREMKELLQKAIEIVNEVKSFNVIADSPYESPAGNSFEKYSPVLGEPAGPSHSSKASVNLLDDDVDESVLNRIGSRRGRK